MVSAQRKGAPYAKTPRLNWDPLEARALGSTCGGV